MGRALTLKKLFMILFTMSVVLGVLTLTALVQLSRKQADLATVNATRYQSYLLADELRQSSDDLTRLARTYVVTGDPDYERQYLDILDIRNGKKPRPQHYERIYWDFVAAGNTKPRPDGVTMALADLMKQAGFSDKEFAKLKEAQGNSDALVKTEVIAMNAVKGLFDDGSGGFTRKDVPDLEMARKLMHEKNYHKYKASIMAPIDDFFVLLDGRTADAIDAATRAGDTAWRLALVMLLLMIAGLGLSLMLTYRRIRRQLGCEPAYAVTIADTIAAGDLSSPIDMASDDRSSLLFSMKSMRDTLAGIVAHVHDDADTISSASTQIAAGNLDLSARTEHQASALEKTASSMEELTSTVRQNADNARQANQLAISASEVAVKGGTVVSQVVDTMGSINDSSKKIVDIIGVIDGIAFQTNILALNAAVEAARAGEQGRGFAVVASEVRSLAQRSAAAAKEIKTLIGDSVEKVELGAKLVDQAGTTMAAVVGSIRSVTDIMGEITAASQEQIAGIEQINQAVAEMDQDTQQNVALVEEAAATVRLLEDKSANLNRLVGVFKVAAPAAGATARPAPARRPPATKPARATAAVGAPAAAKRTARLGRPSKRIDAPADSGEWETF